MIPKSCSTICRGLQHGLPNRGHQLPYGDDWHSLFPSASARTAGLYDVTARAVVARTTYVRGSCYPTLRCPQSLCLHSSSRAGIRRSKQATLARCRWNSLSGVPSTYAISVPATARLRREHVPRAPVNVTRVEVAHHLVLGLARLLRVFLRPSCCASAFLRFLLAPLFSQLAFSFIALLPPLPCIVVDDSPLCLRLATCAGCDARRPKSIGAAGGQQDRK